jgi:hypothetical protein
MLQPHPFEMIITRVGSLLQQGKRNVHRGKGTISQFFHCFFCQGYVVINETGKIDAVKLEYEIYDFHETAASSTSAQCQHSHRNNRIQTGSPDKHACIGRSRSLDCTQRTTTLRVSRCVTAFRHVLPHMFYHVARHRSMGGCR